jgi:hypothetical protein
MGIVSQKKFLNEEELKHLKEIQLKTQLIILELGEIEMFKIQLEDRYKESKKLLNELKEIEINFSKTLNDKYGKINLHPETGEIINID